MLDLGEDNTRDRSPVPVHRLVGSANDKHAEDTERRVTGIGREFF